MIYETQARTVVVSPQAQLSFSLAVYETIKRAWSISHTLIAPNSLTNIPTYQTCSYRGSCKTKKVLHGATKEKQKKTIQKTVCAL